MTKQEATDYLNCRISFFLDEGLIGRAYLLEKILKNIENGCFNEYDYLKTVGLYLNKE